jgi:hypothetical protein
VNVRSSPTAWGAKEGRWRQDVSFRIDLPARADISSGVEFLGSQQRIDIDKGADFNFQNEEGCHADRLYQLG